MKNNVLFKLLRKYPIQLVGIISLRICCAGLQVYASLLLAKVLNHLVDRQFIPFFSAVAWNLCAWLLLHVFYLISAVCEEKYIGDINNDLRMIVSDIISEKAYQQQEENQKTYFAWMTQDIELVNTKGIEIVFDFVTFSSALFFTVLSLIKFHYIILVVAFILWILMNLYAKVFKKKSVEIGKKFSDANALFTNQVLDKLAGLNLYFNMNLMSQFKGDIWKASDSLKKSKIYYRTSSVAIQRVNSAISSFSQNMILLLTGYLIFQGQVEVGAFLAVGNIAGIFFTCISQINDSILKIYSTQEIVGKFDVSMKVKRPNTNSFVFNNRIKLENVSYALNDKLIIEDFSIVINKNEKVAIIGDSGRGKSTLLNLISARNAYSAGKISIDQMEYSYLDQYELKNNITYIDQNAYLFNMSVRDNITMGRDYSDDKIIEMMKELQLNHVLEKIDYNLDFLIEENGKNFSGGEKQRLNLARQLIDPKSIILLDEVTSALDATTREKIENYILSLKEHTIIMVTHHLSDSTKENLDKVIRL
ncbi:ABC transporter ATP-binding protein [Aerococcaceae bacterium zg-ZUI334]|uniref:ATP-binding cassette domain-containing protein n=1 Tax=Aerococcaceae bacterium zg-252 TaxID=2796928 RepID=UPI001B9B06E0|nr:ABC transporter ATP-binding protein [Aerococcaceae bacterium zg-ZUI334]